MNKDKINDDYYHPDDLGYYITLHNGKSKITSQLIENGKFPVFGGNGITGYSNDYLIDEEAIVLGRVGANCGVVHKAPPKSWITDNAMYCRTVKEMDIGFLFYLLTHLNLNSLANKNAQPVINQDQILSQKVSIPSLQIQKKIVQKLDHILGQLEEKKKEISNLIIHNKKRTIKLSDDINGEILTKYFKSDKVIKNSKNQILNDVCVLNPSKSELSDVDQDIDVSFVPMRAVDDVEGVIKMPEIRKLKDVKKGYTYFRENDVIFAKITPCMENGKAAICKHLKNKIGFGSTEFHVLRPKDMVLSEWIYYFIRQNKFRNDAEKVMSGSAGQQRVPISFIESYEIPIPSTKIQQEIIREIEQSRDSITTIQNNIDHLIGYLQSTEERLNSLTASILNSAFSGKLVN